MLSQIIKVTQVTTVPLDPLFQRDRMGVGGGWHFLQVKLRAGAAAGGGGMGEERLATFQYRSGCEQARKSFSESPAEWIIKQIAKWNAIPHLLGAGWGGQYAFLLSDGTGGKTTGPGRWPFNNIAFVNKLENPITVKLTACP